MNRDAQERLVFLADLAANLAKYCYQMAESGGSAPEYIHHALWTITADLQGLARVR